jgi:hypothetical protein
MRTAARDVTLVRVTIGLFAVSTAFPVAAGLWHGSAPRWLGLVDVSVAAALVIAVLVLAARTPGQPSDRALAGGFRLSRAAAGVIPLLLALFFVVVDRINWPVLVIGLAWRGFLFVCVAPYLALEPSKRN